MKSKGDDRTDQQRIGAFLKELRKEKELTQEQLAEKMNVTGRTVSRWETGVNLPDLSLLVELADFYGVDIREIIDGERKSENMEPETKETLLKVSDYAAEDKKRTVKKTKRRFRILAAALTVIVVLTALGLNFFFGNPVSKAMALSNAQNVLDIRFGRGVYSATDAKYWIEDAEYFVRCENPANPDTFFSMNFGMFGNYRFDDYDYRVEQKGNVFDRLDREYNEVVTAAMETFRSEDAEDFCYGAIFSGDDEVIGQDEGKPHIERIQADQVELGQVFDYREIGEKYGEVVVMLDDRDLSAERLASLLLEIKAHLDDRDVRFAAMSLILTDRSSGEIRGEGRGYDSASVWDFPCGLIYEDGLVERVAAAMQN